MSKHRYRSSNSYVSSFVPIIIAKRTSRISSLLTYELEFAFASCRRCPEGHEKKCKQTWHVCRRIENDCRLVYPCPIMRKQQRQKRTKESCRHCCCWCFGVDWKRNSFLGKSRSLFLSLPSAERLELSRYTHGAKTNLFTSWAPWPSSFPRRTSSIDAKDCYYQWTTPSRWGHQTTQWCSSSIRGTHQSWLRYWRAEAGTLSCSSPFIRADPWEKIHAVFIKSISIWLRQWRWWDWSFEPSIQTRVWVQSSEFIFILLLFCVFLFPLFSIVIVCLNTLRRMRAKEEEEEEEEEENGERERIAQKKGLSKQGTRQRRGRRSAKKIMSSASTLLLLVLVPHVEQHRTLTPPSLVLIAVSLIFFVRLRRVLVEFCHCRLGLVGKVAALSSDSR